jgi:hypothetical protein
VRPLQVCSHVALSAPVFARQHTSPLSHWVALVQDAPVAVPLSPSAVPPELALDPELEPVDPVEPVLPVVVVPPPLEVPLALPPLPLPLSLEPP